jgi:hypothetical protein
MRLRIRHAAGLAVTLALCVCARATPVTPERVTELCAQADGPAHCGRLIEADQMKTLPNLATRDGDTLRITLFPSGTREFTDGDALRGGRTYALWDYWNSVNIVVLFTTESGHLGYTVLQRSNGQLTALPAEPALSTDRQRLAVADFCATRCDNEVTVWRVARDGIRKEYGWKPKADWSDVTVQWKDADVLVIEYTPAGEPASRKVERRLTDATWQRFDSP